VPLAHIGFGLIEGIWTAVYIQSQEYQLTTLGALPSQCLRRRNCTTKVGSHPTLDRWGDRKVYAQGGMELPL
jgi:hypothetical protein